MKSYNLMKILTYVGAGALLLFTGCASEGPYVPDARQPSTEIENTTVILDRELTSLVAVDAQEATRTPKGKLKAMANIRNRTNQDLTIQTQTVFRDASGFSIDDETAWQTVFLTANETRTITAQSTERKADRYTIRIRLMR